MARKREGKRGEIRDGRRGARKERLWREVRREVQKREGREKRSSENKK